MPLQLAVNQANGSVQEHLLYEGRQYTIGRSDQADICIAHPQVSRRHACVAALPDNQWALQDVSSTGCYSRGKPVQSLTIGQMQLVSLGPVACQLTPMTATEVVQLDSQRVWQAQQLAYHRERLQQCSNTQALIALAQQCLQQALGCERAAVILVDATGEQHAPVGYPDWLQGAGFTGSRTFIRQCLDQCAPLAIGHLAGDAHLASQASVIRNQIQAAIAVPLAVDQHTLGVLYADSTQGRRYFADADVAFTVKLANLLSLRLLYHTIERKIKTLTHLH